jgi:hypothetical protein
MSFWDDFVDYVENEVVPFWTGEEGVTKAFDMQLGSPSAIGGLAAISTQQQFQGKYSPQLTTALSDYVKEKAADHALGVQSGVGNLFMTPGRVVRETLATPLIAYASGKSLSEAHGLAVGDRSTVKFQGREYGINWWEPGRDTVSVGQALWGAGGRIVPGQQEVDALDWRNSEQVQKYFSDGPQKYFSGAVDTAAMVFADPLIYAGTGAKVARLKLAVQPIKNERQIANHAKLIQDAIDGLDNSWKPSIDYVMENPGNSDALVLRTNIYESTNASELAGSLAKAADLGDRQLVGDIFAAAISDKNAIERLLARKDSIAASVAKDQMLIDQLESGMLSVNEKFIDIIRKSVMNMIDTEDVIIKAIGREGVIGDIQFSGVTDSMSRRTVSRFKSWEELRNITAKQRSQALYNSERVTVDGFGVRVLTWLNPSGPIKEAPGGIINIGNFGFAESWREVQAQARYMKGLTGKDYEWVNSAYLRLNTKEERFTWLNELEKTFVADIIESRLARSGITPSPEFIDAVKLFAQNIIDKKSRLQSKHLGDMIDNGYVVFDGTGDPIIVDQMRTWIQRKALAEGKTFDSMVEELRAEPQFGSQAASSYNFLDTATYANAIDENIRSITSFVHIIEDALKTPSVTGEALTKSQQKALINETVRDVLDDPGSVRRFGQDKAELAKQFKDILTYGLDEFYGNIWKPITIWRVGYGVRNVSEAWLRTIPALLELHSETGVSRRDIFADWAGVEKSDFSRRATNLKNILAARVKAREARELSLETRTAAKAMDMHVQTSVRNMQTGLRSIEELVGRLSTIKNKKLQTTVQKFLSNEFFTKTTRGTSITAVEQSATELAAKEKFFNNIHLYEFDIDANLSKAAVDAKYKWIQEGKTYPSRYINALLKGNGKATADLQKALKDFGFGETITIRRRGEPQGPIVNASISSKWTGESKLHGTAGNGQLYEWKIKTSDVIGLGSVDEGEIFFRLRPEHKPQLVSDVKISKTGPAVEGWTNPIIGSMTNGEARRFALLLYNGDFEQAFKLIQSSKDVATMTKHLSEYKQQLLDTATSFDDALKSGAYELYLSKNQIALIADYQNALVGTAAAIDNVVASRVNSAAAWGEFDTLMAGTTPIIVRKGEGRFEVIPGTHLPDYAEGQLGLFAMGESSADNTFANTILNGNRLIGKSVLSRNHLNVDVKPTDTNWVKAYTSFVNQDLRSDAVVYRMLEGTSDAEIAAWLSKRDNLGYREAVGLTAKPDPAKIAEHIQKIRLMIEHYIPELDGLAPNFLKNKALTGELTEEVAQLIPQDIRVTVVGTDVLNTNKYTTASSMWKKAVELGFKYVGTLPETILARHPFYRAVYRTESRRLAKILDAQGIDLTSRNAIDRIQRASHRRAFKTLNETLYTIERRSEPAQFMRFMSPFYMAQQNSARFWFGQSFKNPALPVLGLLAWNTPNQIFNVLDENGNPVSSSTPFGSNERIYISMPEVVGKLFGNDYVTFSKTSMDLIFQGQIPFIQGMSGAIVSVPANLILQNSDAQAVLTDLGFDGDFIEKNVLPYFNAYNSDIVGQVAPAPAWFNAFRNAGIIPGFGDITQARASRWNLIFEQKCLEADLKGVTLTKKRVKRFMDEANDETTRSYVVEGMSSFFSPVSTKFTNEQDLLHKEYRRYITRYGNVEGAIKAQKEMGIVKSVYGRSSTSSNPAGLFSTPQTERNLKNHMYLAEELAQTEAGFAMLGTLFNAGKDSDYSSVVNAHLYDMTINGKEIKSQNTDLSAANAKRQVNIGWSYYIPFKQALVAKASKQGITVGSADWDAVYKPALDGAVKILEKKYPDWADARTSIDTAADFKNYKELRYALYSRSSIDKKTGLRVWQDDSFYNTVGKDNPIWQGLKSWVVYRDALAVMLKSRESKSITAPSNADLKQALDAGAQIISAKYPEFANLYERYLANDILKVVGK